MKVIVFGGSGFIGSHVADALSDAGHEVVIFDIEPSMYLKGFQRMVTGDILDQGLVWETVKGSDAVYNFAAVADIEEASNKPVESVKTNILGNTVILDACRRAGVKRFIFASSIYVYSKSGSFYRSTKQSCELLTENYNEIFGLPYTIIRYGSLYGPRADKNNFIYSILKQALAERKIVREGDGEEIREYIHVQDAARCSVEVLSEDFLNQHVIITGNQPLKIKDLLFMIKEILSNDIKIEFSVPKTGLHYEITPYTFSPKLAKRYMSKTYLDLGQGLLKMLEEIYGKNSADPVKNKEENTQMKGKKCGDRH